MLWFAFNVFSECKGNRFFVINVLYTIKLCIFTAKLRIKPDEQNKRDIERKGH